MVDDIGNKFLLLSKQLDIDVEADNIQELVSAGAKEFSSEDLIEMQEEKNKIAIEQYEEPKS